MRALVLAPIELDGDALVGPQAVDRPRPDGLVALGQLDAVLDEKVAEAPLEAALHLAVAGRVVLQCRAEVGAARMPAAQRALHVRGTQVVLELGFRERAEEGAGS